MTVANLSITIRADIPRSLRLPTETGADLGPQLFVSWARPMIELFEPIDMALSRGIHRRIAGKPLGGLWTSTLIDGPSSDWVHWCQREEWGGVDALRWWQMVPRADARLLRIDSAADYRMILNTYPSHPYPYPYLIDVREMDFARIAADGYDGIHLTERGMYKTRHRWPDDLNSWDCESTLFLSWCFDGEPELIYQGSESDPSVAASSPPTPDTAADRPGPS